MKRDNYFFILELPFDPPESDTDKIIETILKKQAQWSYELCNPIKKFKAIEYLTYIDDMTLVMLDPVSREQEAEEAKKIKSDKLIELKVNVRLHLERDNTISESSVKALIKKFRFFGISTEEIMEEIQNTF